MIINPYRFVPTTTSSGLYSRSFSTVGYNGLIDAIGTDDGSFAHVNPAADGSGVSLSHLLWPSISSRYSGSAYGPGLATDQTNSTFVHSSGGSSHWWQIDAGPSSSFTIDHYAIHRRESSNSPRNWELQGSNDGGNWTAIDTQVSNTTLATNGWVDIAVSSSGPWRFLRIVCTDTYLIIGGFEVWGSYDYDSNLAEGPRQRLFGGNGYRDLHAMLGTNDRTDNWAYPNDVSRDWPVVVTSLTEYSSSYGPRYALNRTTGGGSGAGFSSASGSAPGQWWKIDYGAGNQVVASHYGLQARSVSNFPRSWRLQGSNNDVDWTDLDQQTANTTMNASGDWFDAEVTDTTPWRYLRVLQTGTNSSGNDTLELGYVAIYGQHQENVGLDILNDISWAIASWADDPSWTNPGDGNAVTSWRNSGTHGGDWEQSTALNRPTFRSSVTEFNNRATVDFDGSNNTHLRLASTPFTTIPTTDIVFVARADASGVQGFFNRGATGGRNMVTANTSSGQWSAYASSHQHGGVTDGNPHLFRAVFNRAGDGNEELWVDGVKVIDANAGSEEINSLVMGTWWASAGSGTRYLNGDMAFFGVHDGQLTAGEIADIEAWAADTYGLTIS